ncbi:Fbxl16, partial [Symbiodinium sp. KB8]
EQKSFAANASALLRRAEALSDGKEPWQRPLRPIEADRDWDGWMEWVKRQSEHYTTAMYPTHATNVMGPLRDPYSAVPPRAAVHYWENLPGLGIHGEETKEERPFGASGTLHSSSLLRAKTQRQQFTQSPSKFTGKVPLAPGPTATAPTVKYDTVYDDAFEPVPFLIPQYQSPLYFRKRSILKELRKNSSFQTVREQVTHPLHTIILRNCQRVTDKGVIHLAPSIPNLTSLDVSGTMITNETLFFLKDNMQRLRSFSVDRCTDGRPMNIYPIPPPPGVTSATPTTSAPSSSLSPTKKPKFQSIAATVAAIDVWNLGVQQWAVDMVQDSFQFAKRYAL